MAEPKRKSVRFADEEPGPTSDSSLGIAPDLSEPPQTVDNNLPQAEDDDESKPEGQGFCSFPGMSDKMRNSFEALRTRSSTWSLLSRKNTIEEEAEDILPDFKEVEEIPDLDKSFDFIGTLDQAKEDVDLDLALAYLMLDLPINFEYPVDLIQPKQKVKTFMWFRLPYQLKKQIYGYLFPAETRKVSLSRKSLTEGVFADQFFVSPWEILDDVWGLLHSCQAWRKEVYFYFWSQYHFFITLNDFSGNMFCPLSHVWMIPHLSTIQRLTIERDYTRLAGSYKNGAEQLTWALSAKSRDYVKKVVDGLLERDEGQTMAGLHIMARKYQGVRPTTNANWVPIILEDNCASVAQLHLILKRLRVTSFSRVFSFSLLKSVFGNRVPGFHHAFAPDDAWGYPLPPLDVQLAELEFPATPTPEPEEPVEPVEPEEPEEPEEGKKLKKKNKKKKKKAKKGKPDTILEDIEDDATTTHTTTTQDAPEELTWEGPLWDVEVKSEEASKPEEDLKPEQGVKPEENAKPKEDVKSEEELKREKWLKPEQGVTPKETAEPEDMVKPEDEVNIHESTDIAVDIPSPSPTHEDNKSTKSSDIPADERDLWKSLRAMNKENERDEAFRKPLQTMRHGSDAAGPSQPAIEPRRTTIDNTRPSNRTPSSALFNRFGFSLGKTKGIHRAD